MLTPQDWSLATPMLSTAFCDAPSLIRFPDGKLLAAVTYSTAGAEGNPDQRVGVILSDDGLTWTVPYDLEAASDRESSWGVAFYDASADRVWVFYVYNNANVRPPAGGLTRADIIGRIVCKYSDDRGLTWSARVYLGPHEAKAIDLRNPFGGADQKHLMWLQGQPFLRGSHLYIPLSKMGNPSFTDTEAFFLRLEWPMVPNAAVQSTVPTGPNGLRIPAYWDVPANTQPVTYDPICEESFGFAHDDGVIAVTCRSTKGRIVESYSVDGENFGLTGWPNARYTDWARQPDGYLTVYNPRGPCPIWRLSDGRLMLWHYNNASNGGFGGLRHVAWYRLGERVGDRIRWGDPYALCFSADPAKGIGYPSLVETDTELLIAAADKTSARLMRFNLSDL